MPALHGNLPRTHLFMRQWYPQHSGHSHALSDSIRSCRKSDVRPYLLDLSAALRPSPCVHRAVFPPPAKPSGPPTGFATNEVRLSSHKGLKCNEKSRPSGTGSIAGARRVEKWSAIRLSPRRHRMTWEFYGCQIQSCHPNWWVPPSRRWSHPIYFIRHRRVVHRVQRDDYAEGADD